MTKDYCKYYNDLEKLKEELEQYMPSTMSSFNKLHMKIIKDGVLTEKTKELIALGIAISVKCNGCIAFHVNDALKAGATSSEIMETIEVAIFMGGEQSMVYGCQALEALNQYTVIEK
ncbi:AhpD family alkylhydroperoxidase [Lutibacter oceani]|uniref:AhpD family alkylhydroperoxidase n=1 Tax=Lutibacter oceani TaxID=1853311 RepID=A0A3D9RS39_9FLAO|nr:carboxymuconolactone decarboxylase family protein [Lutibacter oceani]REE82783.1 AhpD family alkylhydroperoxidase [Lutibacter oceani]